MKTIRKPKSVAYSEPQEAGIFPLSASDTLYHVACSQRATAQFIRQISNQQEKKKKKATAIQFPVDAALFYLTQCFRASDNKPKP